MCGIFGIVDLRDGQTPGRELLQRMGRVIAHRGPDDDGFYFGSGVALGMRRLSIIDVAGGHQPIANEDDSIWLVLNGEIYNFRELRQQLQAKGHCFRTQSDTEVIVHLYEEEGVDFLKKLRGMFGLALWDAKRQRLILGRDRIGEKPLYIRQEQDRLVFASELKAILEDPQVPRRLNSRALEEYLALGYVPAPLCMLDGIDKLLPGHYVVVERGQITKRRYWEVPFGKTEQRREEEWIELVREKLLETVRMQMVSDVPLGAFLSGGLDSSTIVAAMSRMTNHAVKTYSIGYEGEHSYYNELPYALAVAQAFGTDHHEIVVHPEVSELLPKLVWHLDEPVADSACLTTYLVSSLARKTVTVILSGVGGDELFGGYRRYLGNSLIRYYQWLPSSLRRKLLPGLFARVPQDRHSWWKDYARYAAAFVRSAGLDPAARYMSYVTLFSRETQRQFMNTLDESAENHAVEALHAAFDRCNDPDSLNRIFYTDLTTSLPDDLLAMTDRMSMAASIECRAPLVDHEIVELAMRIPSRFKIHGFNLKYLMKKAVSPWLPEKILHRKKRGFGAPMGAWLRKDIQPMLSDLLSEQNVRSRGLFRWSAVQELIADHAAERRDYTDHLFALLVLELWCKTYLDAPASDISGDGGRQPAIAVHRPD